MRKLLVAMLVCGLSTSPARAQAEPETRAVADRYLELTFSQQYDALRELYAPDAIFHDPTADFFVGPISEGPVQGVEPILAMQKSWRLAETDLQLAASFTVGQYALYRGVLTIRYQGSESRQTLPFVTVLRVEDGRISERLDFGEYVASSGQSAAFAEATATTRRVADRYLAAYLGGDLETQGELAAPGIRFQDPTAAVFGPASAEPITGWDELGSRRQKTWENVSAFALEVSESFYANHHAVFMGTTRFTLKSGRSFAHPAVFVIEVRDGRVTRHWDFVDYSAGATGS